jgi:hypothetical protein
VKFLIVKPECDIGQIARVQTFACISARNLRRETKPRNFSSIDGESLLVVDLDLPGIWKIDGDKQTLYVRGTKYLRKPSTSSLTVIPSSLTVADVTLS